MNDRFFLDTNIFVYSLAKGPTAKKDQADLLIADAITSGKGMVSYQVVQEFFSVAFRRFTPPMSPFEAEQYLAMTFRPLLALHSSYSLFGQALYLHRQYSLSWYDSLIVAAAKDGECGVLYSEDFQYQQKFEDLKVVNPFL